MEKIKQIQEITKELNQYRNEYYNFNKPSVSDVTYDQKFDQLQKLEQEIGFTMSNSPTISVGYEVISKLQKVEHPIPLKSLDKTKSIEELNKWRKNKDILLMLKADGLTIELVYDNGIFQQGSTRGNSLIGEDISHNVKVFKNIPLVIPFKSKLRISGEAIIHKKDFDEINLRLSDEDKYATPRNLCSGSVRQLDSKICSERSINFYAFNILECSEQLSDSKYENFKWLGKQGFWTILNTKISEDITNEFIENMKNVAEDMGIPIDGLVISFDSVSYSNSLQETSHHPLHSLAFKFEDETEKSVLRSVEWNTTRTGQVNPTAIFDKVILDNTEVSRASLFNLTFIEDLGLTIGSRINVSKRNMIIPYIEENLSKSVGVLKFPNNCPACGSQTIVKNTGTADFLFCTNDNCSAKLVDKFVHFVKRDCMNIDGLSEAGLQLLIDKGFLKTFDDLYNLEQYKSKIVKLDGWGSKSYNKLIGAIEKSKKVKLENFIYALGINQIGKSSSKAIAKHFNNNWDAFEKSFVENFNFSQLADFGEISNQSLQNWFDNKEEYKMWNKLTSIVEFIQEEKKDVVNVSENPFKGQRVYATGKFSLKKDELKIKLEELGAIVESGYKKSLDMLICGGDMSKSGKADKATKDGVKMVSEEYLMQYLK